MPNNNNESLNLSDFFISSLKTLFSYAYDPSENLTKMTAVHVLGATEAAINTFVPIMVLHQLTQPSMEKTNSVCNKQVLMIASAFTASVVLPRIRGLLMGSVKRNVQRQVSLDMVQRVYQGPLDEHIAEPTGDLVATISKNYAETEKVMPVSVELLNVSLETLLRSATLFRSYGWAGLTPLAVFFPYLFAAFGGEVYGGLLKLKNSKFMVEAFDKLLETVNNYTVSHQNDSAERELSKLKDKVIQLESSFQEVGNAEEITALVVTLINRLGFLAAIASLYFNPPMDNFWNRKESLLFSYYILTSAMKFETLPPKLNSLLTGIAGAFLVDKFFKTHPVLDNPEKPLPLDLKAAPTIEFKGVNFSYGEDKKSLEDINFVARAGSTVVIMGPTGCGKSTILKILQRFYNYTGEILVDGIDIAHTDLRNYRKYISAVSQDTNLVNDTLKENIRYSDPFVSEEAVKEAAHFAKFNLDDRINSIATKGGINFSGGEKQRVLIARALIKGGGGYIFLGDEITSALDQETSREIYHVLEELGNDVTKILVTHDPNLVRNADLIICMQDGKIAQQGTFDQLIASKQGQFFKLYETMCQKLGVSVDAVKRERQETVIPTELTTWARERRHSYFQPKKEQTEIDILDECIVKKCN